MIYNTASFMTVSDGSDGTYFVCKNENRKSIIDEILFDNDGSIDRIAFAHLSDPFFMNAGNSDSAASLPYDTQFSAIRFRNGGYAVVVPLAMDTYSCTLHSNNEGSIMLHAESGDNSVVAENFDAVYYSEGDSLYALIENMAKSFKNRYGIRLRKDKKLPEFAKYFGWCTWNAFYSDVTEQNVIDGYGIFREKGFIPKLLILDDGWQSVSEKGSHRGNHQLKSHKPNEKFGNSFAHLSDVLKKQYGVEYFMVWHAMCGYWGGVDVTSEEMKKYEPHYDAAIVQEGQFKHNSGRSYNECFPFGLVNDFDGFYNDYHSLLKSEGVDGVKVDVQSIIASHGRGNGGRIKLTEKMHKALDNSVNKNFNGNMINCMATGNEIIYHSNDSFVTRTSGDFRTRHIEFSFGHIFDNAVSSLFIGEFLFTDWDMFWSKEQSGKYHAIARAVSGGPIYVSDGLNNTDYDIVGKLTDSRGRAFICDGKPKISENSLFDDIREKKEPLVIYNENKFNKVTAVFNPLSEGKIEYEVVPEENTAYRSFNGFDSYDKLRIELDVCDADLITAAPVVNGVAVFGLVDKYNGGAAVLDVQNTEHETTVVLSDGGMFGFYTASENTRAFVDGKEVSIINREHGFCKCEASAQGKCEIKITH